MQSSASIINQELLDEIRLSVIILCKGFDADNKPIWAYLCIRPNMAQAFLAARDQGNLDISEFGTVLESGDGIEPGDLIKARMERDFGVCHGGTEALLERLAKTDVKPDDAPK